jgi:hypothetical protein
MRILNQSGIAALTAAALMPAVLTGCGGGDDAESTEVQAVLAPPVDPRFASAEALLDYYNELAMREPAIDPEPLFDLLYAENDLQKRLIQVAESISLYMRLEQAVWDRFGDTIEPSAPHPPLTPNPQPAQFTSRDSDRATAAEIDAAGKERTLYFVRVGDRWWLSGYTLEYDPGTAEIIENLEGWERAEGAATPHIRMIHDRLERGEFRTIADVRQAFRTGR